MKKLFAFCLMALFAISMSAQSIGPSSPYVGSSVDGFITFDIKQSAASKTSQSELCEVWASDNYNNKYDRLVGRFPREGGFGTGLYSIPIKIPYYEDAGADIYFTVVFKNVKDGYFTCTSNYFMYYQSHPLIYKYDDSCTEVLEVEPGKYMTNRYFVLKARVYDWEVYYYDTYNVFNYPHPQIYDLIPPILERAPIMILN